MVYINFPPTLTEEEEILRQKYAKLRKKKKQLAALRSTSKPEREAPVSTPAKRSVTESAEDAKEQAKKLLKSGSIRIKADSQDKQSFKRSKNLERKLKDPASTPSSVGFQPFSASHPEEEDKETSKKPRLQKLYDSFVSGGYEREREERRDEKRMEMRDRDREVPKRGNTIYVHGHGITEDILRKAFSNIGSIVNINMEKEKKHEICIHCNREDTAKYHFSIALVGFVTFEKMDSADTAIAEVNGALMDGVKLSVSIARRQPTFEASDQSTASWSSIAASSSQKGSHKDRRDMVTYDAEDIF